MYLNVQTRSDVHITVSIPSTVCDGWVTCPSECVFVHTRPSVCEIGHCVSAKADGHLKGHLEQEIKMLWRINILYGGQNSLIECSGF